MNDPSHQPSPTQPSRGPAVGASAAEDASLEALESLVAEVADEFLECRKRGERPDVEAYAARHPEAAPLLRRVLASLEVVGLSLGGRRDLSSPRILEGPETGTLGDYRLLREVGRGGMGIVYEAEQISLGRRVALKVLPFASALDPRQLQRFQNEARAAACLNHPHIVPIYGVGQERGVHYYAMQFVDGQTLSALVRELKQGPPEPDRPTSPSQPAPSPARSPSLPGGGSASTAALAFSTVPSSGRSFFRRVAELGVQAAEALEHAHQMAIVHRDVKPANLMLDARGNLWVTDFGLAHLPQAGGDLTRTGDVVGTLRYMSPEQGLARRVPLDHRTDVYSLGATLYELMTLEPAFEGNDRHELLQRIALEEPRRPRLINRAIPAELETIVLKAMEKEPSERYATAQEFADDLRRFLEDTPIRARRPTLPRRLARWSRRHRAVVATSVALLLAAVVVLTFSNVRIAQKEAETKEAYRKLADHQERIKEALEAEARARARAEDNFRHARNVVDYLVQVGEVELADRPELQPVRREVLTVALDYYQDFVQQHANDPGLLATLAASQFRIGTILEAMGSHAEARVAHEQACKLQERLCREHPEVPRYRDDLSAMRRHFARLPGGLLSLLTQESVQKELHLSETQARRAKEVAEAQQESWRSAWREPRDPDRNVARKKFEERMRTAEKNAEKAIRELLQPEQTRRFEQISLQLRGTRALGDPDVAAALHLTDEQKGRIKAIQEEARQARHRHFPPPGQGGEEARLAWEKARKAMEEVRKGTGEKLRSVLTEEQKKKWQELCGSPFGGEIRPPHWGGHKGPDRVPHSERPPGRTVGPPGRPNAEAPVIKGQEK
jgi:serine/threonine protein kinase